MRPRRCLNVWREVNVAQVLDKGRGAFPHLRSFCSTIKFREGGITPDRARVRPGRTGSSAQMDRDGEATFVRKAQGASDLTSRLGIVSGIFWFRLMQAMSPSPHFLPRTWARSRTMSTPIRSDISLMALISSTVTPSLEMAGEVATARPSSRRPFRAFRFLLFNKVLL